MIALIIVVILLCSAMSDWASGADWEASERNAELRHQEMLEAYERQTKVLKKKPASFNRITRKRAITDGSGRTLVEEVIVDGDFGDNEDEEY